MSDLPPEAEAAARELCDVHDRLAKDLGVWPMFYDREGRPIGTWEWTLKFDDFGYRVVCKTRVGGAEVSTVWLGLDHSLGEGPPMIFETMVFDDGKPGEDEHCERYPTEEAAVAGHEGIVEALTLREAAVDDPPA